MDKIITIKEAKKIKQGDNEWIELTDQEDKVHRVFRSMQRNDGEWLHFDDQLDMLEQSQGKTLKLTKEKKGNFWNVIGVETVGDVFVREAQKQVEDKSSTTQNKGYALIRATDLAVADRIKLNNILSYAEAFYRYMTGDIEVKDEAVFKALMGKYFIDKSEEQDSPQ